MRPFLPLLLGLALACPAQAQLTRQANTTLAFPATPPTPSGYTLSTIFLPGSTTDPTFSYPVKIVTPPGDPANRVFVLERTGLIRVFDPAVPTASPATFMNMTSIVASSTSQGEERGALGLAFHPQWRTNGYFYVYYSNSTGGANQRVSRFQFTGADPNANTGNLASEAVFFRQADPASNHNGGDIMFGNDGYLYISVGDGGGANDSTGGSQKLDGGLFSGIFRIDVDRRTGNLEPNTPNPSGNILTITPNPNNGNLPYYKIPADNPFIGATSFNGVALANPAYARTEYYAIGLRNPWRMNFDPANGRLYVGDVGQGTREEVDLIVKGGNYGWKWREGFVATPGVSGSAPAGFSPLDPILDYPTQLAITGGLVYRGSGISQLYGQYIFADYNGPIWRQPLNETTGVAVGSKVQIATATSPVAFGTDPRNGDVLVAQIGGSPGAGRLRRLSVSSTSGSLPATLSATGAFASLNPLTPNAGIVSYEPNVSFWSDYAVKQRWFSVPNVNDKLTFTPTGAWTSPAGSVWIKHFEINTTRGNSKSPRKRLETRFLIRNANGVYGLTYKWNAAGTEADLVPEEGTSETFQVDVGGTPTNQTWNYPSRASCLNCHTQVGGYTLSFNSQQMNRNHDYNAQNLNQIEALSAAGYFSNPASIPATNTIVKFADANENSQSVEWRVRSYLAVNCVSCHQPGGLGVGNWDARHTVKTADAGLINGALVNNLGDPANRVLASNDLAHSVMYQRIASAGGTANHMPPIATNETNPDAVTLLASWVQGDMQTFQSFTQWRQANFGSTSSPAGDPNADPDGDGRSNRFEYLTGTNPNSAASAWSISVGIDHGQASISFPRIAGRRFLIHTSGDLQNWAIWNAAGNTGAYSPAGGFIDTIIGPRTPGVPQFFRVEIDEP